MLLSVPTSEQMAFTPDHALASTELVNIAFGHAAAPLAELVGAFVTLTVPKVDLLSIDDIPDALAGMIGVETSVHVVRQAFRPHFSGECLLILEAGGSDALRALLGIDECESELADREAVIDAANIVIGACLSKLSELLEANTTYSQPVIALYRSPLKEILPEITADKRLTQALLIRTAFHIDTEPKVNGFLLILSPEPAMQWLIQALDRFLESL